MSEGKCRLIIAKRCRVAIAGSYLARRELEEKLGRTVVTPENFLGASPAPKRLLSEGEVFIRHTHRVIQKKPPVPLAVRGVFS